MIKTTANVLAVFLLSWSAIMLVSSAPEMETHGLITIGTVEGKTYFYEKNTTSWTGAKQRCEEAGMHLATITTSAQLGLLKTFYNLTLNYGYWIGARDAQSPTQFVWDYNNGPLSTSLFTNFTYSPIQTCVHYAAYDNTAQFLWSFPCTNLYWVLCEIIHNKNV